MKTHKFKSKRTNESQLNWFEQQIKLISQYLKQNYGQGVVSVKTFEDSYIYYNNETHEIFATLDDETGECLIY